MCGVSKIYLVFKSNFHWYFYLLQEEFRSRGESCKIGEESPPATFYPRDELQCDASINFFSWVLLIFVTAFIKGIS